MAKGKLTTSYEKQVQAIALCIQASVPVHLQGPPGTGKTQTVYAIARALMRYCKSFVLSQREPADIGGYPAPGQDEDGNPILDLVPCGALRKLAKKRGICLLDEFTTCSQKHQAAALKLINENLAGDFEVEGVSWVLASNPVEQAAGGYDISAPAANRMIHIEWSLDAEAWCDGALSGFAMPEIPRLPANWEDYIPETRAIVVSYIHSFKKNLLIFPKNESDQSGPWPSPRTWEMVWRLMAACRAAQINGEVLTELVAGAVGPALALEFTTWYRELDMPDPETLLKDPDHIKLPLDRLDKIYAILANVALAVISTNTIPRWTAGIKVMAKAAQISGHPDIAAAAAKMLASNRPKGAAAPQEAGVFLPLFQKAGLFPTAGGGR